LFHSKAYLIDLFLFVIIYYVSIGFCIDTTNVCEFFDVSIPGMFPT